MSERICAVFNVSSEYPDEAIDTTLSDLVSYVQTYNPAKLVFKEGIKPTKFNIRRLSPEEVSMLSSRAKTHSAEVASILAITCGLVTIESPDGSLYEPEMSSMKIGSKDISIHKDPNAVVAYLVDTYGYDIIIELSNAIRKVSTMPLHLSPFLPKSR